MKNLEERLIARHLRKGRILQEGGEQSLSHSEEDLARIRRSLQRLKTGSYGSCIDCGDPIPEKRLKLLPEAERCTGCQEAHEKGLN